LEAAVHITPRNSITNSGVHVLSLQHTFVYCSLCSQTVWCWIGGQLDGWLDARFRSPLHVASERRRRRAIGHLALLMTLGLLTNTKLGPCPQ
jgi:hypothetical protein